MLCLLGVLMPDCAVTARGLNPQMQDHEPQVLVYGLLKVDRTWGTWGSYYNIPKAIFYLLRGTTQVLLNSKTTDRAKIPSSKHLFWRGKVVPKCVEGLADPSSFPPLLMTTATLSFNIQ